MFLWQTHTYIIECYKIHVKSDNFIRTPISFREITVPCKHSTPYTVTLYYLSLIIIYSPSNPVKKQTIGKDGRSWIYLDNYRPWPEAIPSSENSSAADGKSGRYEDPFPIVLPEKNWVSVFQSIPLPFHGHWTISISCTTLCFGFCYSLVYGTIRDFFCYKWGISDG